MEQLGGGFGKAVTEGLIEYGSIIFISGFVFGYHSFYLGAGCHGKGAYIVGHTALHGRHKVTER